MYILMFSQQLMYPDLKRQIKAEHFLLRGTFSLL